MNWLIITIALLITVGVITTAVFYVIHRVRATITPMHNPGVSVKDQVYCHKTRNPEVCCECDDWQGDGIVPRKNAAKACRSGKCDA